MEIHFKSLLLFLGGFIILAILIDAIRSQLKSSSSSTPKQAAKQANASRVETQQSPQDLPTDTAIQQNLLLMSLHAPQGKTFGNYDLLQSLGDAGLIFGEHQIFHYRDTQTNKPLFSVAKLTNPGTFDIDNIESMSCQGLLFFMDLKTVANPFAALDHMLISLDQLAQTLAGYCYEGYRHPCQHNTRERLLQQIQGYLAQHADETADSAIYSA